MAVPQTQVTPSLRESNEEMYQLLRPEPIVSEKLSALLNYYQKPAQDAEQRLLGGEFKLGGIEPISKLLRAFINKLAKKLNLHQQQAFQLAELFFMKQPAVFDRVKFAETEEIERELMGLFKPIAQLYYGERLFLIHAETVLVASASLVDSVIYHPCMEFYMEKFARVSLADLAWDQFISISGGEVPAEMFAPAEREEWLLQNLEEQKALLELLAILQFDLYQCSPSKFLTYLTTFKTQQFKGNFTFIQAETHVSEFRARQEQLAVEIGDVSMFLLLSCIKLDMFSERGFSSSFDKAKNPYNFLSDGEFTPKLIQFFQQIRRGDEPVSEHFGPVMLSWICALHWGLTYPAQCPLLRDLGNVDDLQRIVSQFFLLEFLSEVTKRSTFTSSSEEMTAVMKYLLKTLISTAHSQLNIEQAQNYPILVDITCEVLSGDGSTSTLTSFWADDFPNKTGLYHMLQRLSSSFPHEARDYLKFVRTLIGSNDPCFATQVVNLLDSLNWYTATVNQGDLDATEERRSPDDYYYEASHEMKNRTLLIPAHTRAIKLEIIGRDRYLAQFAVDYSLWPMVFIIWESTLESLKLGQQNPPNEMQVLYEYVDLLATIVRYAPELAERVEALGAREPANRGIDIEYVTKPLEQPNVTLASYLLQSFSAFSKLPEVPLPTIAKIVEALAAIYLNDLQLQRNNSVAMMIQAQTVDSYGYVSASSPHPFFPSANKIRMAENETGNRRATLSVLEFIMIILRDQSCLSVFPLSTCNFLREVVKFSINEVGPDCLTWESSVDKWEALSLCFQIIEQLLSYFSQFAYPKAEITRTEMHDLIVTHLNKTEVFQMLEYVLEVSQKDEDVFENTHWGEAIYRNATVEYCNTLIQAILKAVLVLDKGLELLLYALKTQDQLFSAGRLQFLSDLHRALSAFQGSEDTVGLVPTLMVYATHQFGTIWEVNEEDTTLAALKGMGKIVMVMDLLPQKPSLLQCLGGFCDGLRIRFATNLLNYLGDKVRELPEIYRMTLGSHYLDLLTLCAHSQKSFLVSLFSFTDSGSDTLDKVLVNLFPQRALHLARNPTPSGITLICHALIFLRELYEQEGVYKSQVASLKKSQNFLQDLFQTLAILVTSQRGEDSPEAKCVLLTIIKCLMDILGHEALRPANDVTGHLIAKFFSADNNHLQDVLHHCSAPVGFEHIVRLLQDAESHLRALQLSLLLTDFARYSYSLECWPALLSNPSPYGEKYWLDLTAVRMVTLNAGGAFLDVETMTTACAEFNLKRSLADAQFAALESFKKTFAIVSSFGEKGATYSTLPSCTESAFGSFSGLFNSLKDAPEQSVVSSLRLLEAVIATIWGDITRETDLELDAVKGCMGQKYQILMFAYNYTLFLWKLTERWEEEGRSNKAKRVPPQQAVETNELKSRVSALTVKVFYELIDHISRLVWLDPELLHFILVFLCFISETEADVHYSDSSSNPMVLIQEISRFFVIDAEMFGLMVCVLEQVIMIVKDSSYVDAFRSGTMVTVMMEKVTQSKCSEQEFLAVLRFFFAYGSTVEGAQHLLSEKLLMCLSQAPLLKELKTEYSDTFRNTTHILWCWVLKILASLLDKLRDEAGFMTHSLHFLKTFQSRIELVLRYNATGIGSGSGRVVEHKQFSAGYLEELEGVTGLLERYMRQPRILKTYNRDYYNLILQLLAEHTLRIYTNGTDLAYVYPPIAEHEQKAASFRPDEAATKEAVFTTSAKAATSEPERDRFRTVLDHRYVNADTEEAKNELENYRPSIFHLHIEATLINNLLQTLTCLYKAFVFERSETMRFTRETVSILIDVCRFCVHTRQKWKAHMDYRRILYAKAENLYASVEASIAYGSLNHAFITSEQQQLESLHVAMEMALYLFIKHYEAQSMQEGRHEMKRLLGRWVALLNDDVVVKEFVKTGNPILDWAQERFQETVAPGTRTDVEYQRRDYEEPYRTYLGY